jgi:LmbE family N-acetylglucosaminyl deacetylase
MNHKTSSKIYALGIVAHPDDETFLFAGTCLKFKEKRLNTAVICATKGEKGADRLNRNLTKKQMATERMAELKKAAKIMELSFVKFYNYKDGGLGDADQPGLVSKLVKELETFQPEIVLTFGKEGISGHNDHIAIGRAALAAVRKSKFKPKEIWLASMPASKIKNFNANLAKRKVHHSHFRKQILKGVADNKLLKINIKKFRKEKEAAIRTHKSQYLPGMIMDNFLTQEYFEVVKIKP